ncbi:hypothetical protein B4144_3877 [Bacillus atrophaeus]|nr:hypothetical protein D068_cds39050 [Bacillus atrophaeus UCMB-5137]KYD06577.1 hypothetical protein B4144_3877 [Bacillus atrophaeus]
MNDFFEQDRFFRAEKGLLLGLTADIAVSKIHITFSSGDR